MFDKWEQCFQSMPARQRLWLSWASVGLAIDLAAPSLGPTITAVGVASLWLWLLPLAALAIDLLVQPTSQRQRAGRPAAASTAPRRNRVRRAGLSRALSSRLRPRPDARSGRRAGSA